MPTCKRKVFEKKMPENFSDETVKIIKRLEENPSVIGVLYLRGGSLEFYTVPEIVGQVLLSKLPALNLAMHQAVTEIDIQNELVAYRIETKRFEIAVTNQKDFSACVVHRIKKRKRKAAGHHQETAKKYLLKTITKMKIISNLLKDNRDELLVRTTAVINSVNPIVDRIMNDESVEGVVMTNKEGAPVLTNVSLTSATNYGPTLHRFASLTQCSIKELDIFDDVLIVRLLTKKKEIMLAPDPDFNLIVIQHARRKIKENQRKKVNNHNK